MLAGLRTSARNQLKIGHGTTGTSTHLIHAAPGVYCLSSIHTSSVVLGMGNRPCIELAAGQNRYFGRINLDDNWDVSESSDYQSATESLAQDFSGQELTLVEHHFYQAN